MKYSRELSVVFLVFAPILSTAAILSPGLYRNEAGHSLYVGVENAAPDPAVNQYLDPSNQHTGDLAANSHLKPQTVIREDARIVDTPGGALGTSLYFTGTGKRATIILIHGADQETREMGFLIPYFVLNGVNVISYDQRGTGKSSGNWLRNGPPQRAADVAAVYDAYSTSLHVDAAKMGVWGFSNGGWAAPIVATARPLAFMLLKGAPASSTEDNICYAVAENLRRKHYDAETIAAATGLWRALIGALSGQQSWDTARGLYEAARAKPWFADTYIPFFIPANTSIPPPAETAEGIKRYAVFDPADTLAKVHTPTLALFGALDRNVDVARDVPLFRSAFARAGLKDFTVQVYKDSGHSLKVSASGFNGDVIEPERLTAGYPQIMIEWLRERGFLVSAAAVSKISSHSK